MTARANRDLRVRLRLADDLRVAKTVRAGRTGRGVHPGLVGPDDDGVALWVEGDISAWVGIQPVGKRLCLAEGAAPVAARDAQTERVVDRIPVLDEAGVGLEVGPARDRRTLWVERKLRTQVRHRELRACDQARRGEVVARGAYDGLD